jgi:hypothetical protein
MQKIARESRQWTRISEENFVPADGSVSLFSVYLAALSFIRAYSRAFAGN